MDLRPTPDRIADADTAAVDSRPVKILELATCPACGASTFRSFDLGEGNFLRRCTECHTVSAHDYADPAEVYVDGYMFGQAGDFGLDVTHPTFQKFLGRVADRRIAMIEKATGLPGGSLLDVGSGTGEVLQAAQERGWFPQGVEPERTAAEMARERGLDVVTELLEEAGLPESHYDVVSAFHVLEHMPDSRGFLQTMSRWVRPGGFVVVEVPNFNSVQRRRLREDWPGLRPREHIVHFTPQTLERVLRAVGITPVMMRSPAYLGPPQTLDHALADLVRHGRYRRLLEPLSSARTVDGHTSRLPTRAGWAVLRATEALYDIAGVGSVVFAVGSIH
jgi:SAM-dependent methyltransferase